MYSVLSVSWHVSLNDFACPTTSTSTISARRVRFVMAVAAKAAALGKIAARGLGRGRALAVWRGGARRQGTSCEGIISRDSRAHQSIHTSCALFNPILFYVYIYIIYIYIK